MLGTHYGAEIRNIVEVGPCIRRCAKERVSSNDYSISVKDPLLDLPEKFSKMDNLVYEHAMAKR